MENITRSYLTRQSVTSRLKTKPANTGESSHIILSDLQNRFHLEKFVVVCCCGGIREGAWTLSSASAWHKTTNTKKKDAVMFKTVQNYFRLF